MSMFDGGGATVGATATRLNNATQVGPTNPPPPGGPAPTPAQQQQFGLLASYLSEIGLDSLFSIDSRGRPGGWLWNQLRQGIDTPEELRIALEGTDVFRNRFAVIVEQQRQAGAGQPTYVMSPSEVIEYENQAKQLMSAAGLPSTFYDDPKDFHKLILNDMSISEVQDRIREAYDFVQSAPTEVRRTFSEYFGVGLGDAALAAYALDPERTVRDMTRMTRTAYAGGMAERFDVAIAKSSAERIADLPLTEGGIVEGMKQVAALSPVFNESLGESGVDLTQDLGVQSVFEADAEATGLIDRRIAQRRQVGRANTGGAVITQQGVVGVGSS